MQPRIMYIEHKTNRNHRGEAWIGKVEFSRTGQTVYFNNQAFKNQKSRGIWGNHYDLETGDEYWISGVKKNGQDRHWVGGGKIKIEEAIINEYLDLVEFERIDNSNFEIVNIQKTDKSKFNQIENKSFNN